MNEQSDYDLALAAIQKLGKDIDRYIYMVIWDDGSGCVKESKKDADFFEEPYPAFQFRRIDEIPELAEEYCRIWKEVMMKP